MSKPEKLDQLVLMLEDLKENAFFDVQSPRYDKELVDIVMNAIIGLCTAWWSIQELMDFLKNRSEYRSVINGSHASS